MSDRYSKRKEGGSAAGLQPNAFERADSTRYSKARRAAVINDACGIQGLD